MIPAWRWAAMRAILMFHNCEGQSQKTVSTGHNFWRERRAEADSNLLPSAYQHKAWPLGQTGSHFPVSPISFLLSGWEWWDATPTKSIGTSCRYVDMTSDMINNDPGWCLLVTENNYTAAFYEESVVLKKLDSTEICALFSFGCISLAILGLFKFIYMYHMSMESENNVLFRLCES